MPHCPTCRRETLELLHTRLNGGKSSHCEPCYRVIVIRPLVALRANALAEVAKIDQRLTIALELLARSYRHDLNPPPNCRPEKVDSPRAVDRKARIRNGPIDINDLG